MVKTDEKIAVVTLQEREYHKSKQCPYSNNFVLCQEGYCNRCYLFEQYVNNTRKVK